MYYKEDRFPKAKLFQVEWFGRYRLYLLPKYWRFANCASLVWLGVMITWRRPWLQHVVYEKGFSDGAAYECNKNIDEYNYYNNVAPELEHNDS